MKITSADQSSTFTVLTSEEKQKIFSDLNKNLSRWLEHTDLYLDETSGIRIEKHVTPEGVVNFSISVRLVKRPV